MSKPTFPMSDACGSTNQ